MKTRSVSFLSLLALAFIILKLCHVIDWSWWWVTAPLWGGLAFVLLLMLFGVIAFTLSVIVSNIFKLWK